MESLGPTCILCCSWIVQDLPVICCSKSFWFSQSLAIPQDYLLVPDFSFCYSMFITLVVEFSPYMSFFVIRL